MAKNKQVVGDLIDDLQFDISLENEKKIPDIISFVEDKKWLGLPHNPFNPINLYPMQKIVLKTFYKGSPGNEDIKLTEVELNLLNELGLNDDSRGNVIKKYNEGNVFRELVLVWGRRSSKDFIVSIIALYEAMKLLECEGGNPYALYELSSANTINILTIANSSSQAGIAFAEIKEKILYSQYFGDKYIKDGMTSGSIYLLTPQDKKDNKEFKERGLPQKKGSVGILVGHSNSDTLLGSGCMVLILDEVASYKTTGGSSSGDRIYTALTPMTKTYVKRKYKKDKDGIFVLNEHGQKIISERIYDGKVISISSPRGPEGKFHELFSKDNQVPNRLSMRLPTWHVNPTHTRESLRDDEPTMSESEFMMEYGAEFSGTGMESFFTEEQVKSCFEGHNFKDTSMGSQGNIYFIHLDPATSSHNYALSVVHSEYFMNPTTMKKDFKVIVDHIKYWQPLREPINPEEVIHYVIGLKRRFRIGMVTYDQWLSSESILRMRKEGIRNKETRFTSQYKFKIYKSLEWLINSGRLIIPHNNLLYNEMIELQRKITPTGFKVLPKQYGDGAKSDDICDSVAGAAYAVLDQKASTLPRAKIVSLGNPQGQDQVWRNMQGGITGIGSGQQVSSFLDSMSSAYRNRNVNK